MSSEIQKTLENIAHCSRLLDETVVELGELDLEHVYAKSDAIVAYARAFMSSDGPMEVRKQQSLLDTFQERLDEELAEAKLRACKARLQKLHAQLDMLRTINAAQRAQFQAEPFGQYT